MAAIPAFPGRASAHAGVQNVAFARFYLPASHSFDHMGEILTGILDELCTRTDMLFMLFVLELLFLGISLVAVSVTSPNSATFVVWILNLVGLVVLMLFSGSALVLCFRRV